MDLSIVVPLYNEQESIELLYAAIVEGIAELDLQVEIIFIDDGSSDDTYKIAARLAGSDARLRVVKFRRNYGQTPAMAAGIDVANGRYIVTMDGDLQNDPRDIGLFVEKLDEGFDLVVGWRFNRQDKFFSRKVPSYLANWLIGKVTGVPIKDNGCSLKGFRAAVIKSVPLYSEMHRFIPAMASIAGPKIAEIKVRHHARKFGESKYGLSRVYKVLIDLLAIRMVSGFAERPMKWFALITIPFVILSASMLTWQLTSFVSGGKLSLPIAGSAVFLVVLCIFLILSGGLAELIIRSGSLDIIKMRLLTATEQKWNRSDMLAGAGSTEEIHR